MKKLKDLKPVHTVTEKWDCRGCLAVFYDSLTWQCGQGFRINNQGW